MNIVIEEIKGISFASLFFGNGQAINLTNGQETDKEILDNLLLTLEVGNSV